MPCYARPAILALVAAAVIAAAWTHALAGLPPVLFPALAAAATLAVLGVVVRITVRDRAGQGACTGCRLACQQPAVRSSSPAPWPQPGSPGLRITGTGSGTSARIRGER